MSCCVLSFSNLSPHVVTRLVQRANQYGADLPDPLPPYGERRISTAQGQFEFAWNFDATLQLAELQCTKNPEVIPCAVISEKVIDAVKKCGGNPG